MTAAEHIRGRFALANTPEGKMLMTPITWRGHTAVVADGGELIEVDCSRVVAAMAPVDITTRLERIAFGTNERGRVVTMTFDDVGSAITRTPFSQFPPDLMCVWAAGDVFHLGEVHSHFDAGPDAQITVFFEHAGALAEAA